MFIDKHLEFCDSEDVSGTVGTEVIAAAIDLDRADTRLGAGRPTMYLVIGVAVGFAGASGVVQFALVSDSTDPASTDGTQTQHLLTDAYGVAELPAGRRIILTLPSGNASPYEKYLQLLVIRSGATITAGTINAYLTHTPDDWQAMPEANS